MRSINLAMVYQDYKEAKTRLEYGDVFDTKVQVSAIYIPEESINIATKTL